MVSYAGVSSGQIGSLTASGERGETDSRLSRLVLFGVLLTACASSSPRAPIPGNDPDGAGDIPRAELYLRVDDAAAYHARALAHGAVELSPLVDRDWGDRAAYSLDPDGHVLAFAEPAGDA